MNITLGDIRNDVNDNCQNYDVTSIDKGNVTRQMNRAIEYIQRRLGLPSNKQYFSFYFYDDTKYYDCPEGFDEFIQLYYDSNNPNVTDNNKAQNRWYAYKDNEINNSTYSTNFGIYGNHIKNRVAVTSKNGKNQLLLSGGNIRGGETINSFDTTDGLTYSSDISNVTIDTNVYKEGSGSLKFDTNDSLSYSSIIDTSTWNIQSLMNIGGAYRLYVYFPTDSTEQFSSVELRFESSTGNYYSILTTVQNTGAAWQEEYWNLLGWKLSDAVVTGTPDSTAITSISVIFHHSALYSGVSSLRIDYLYQVNPDYVTCMYWSAFKGTDTTGATPKIMLDDDTDICYFGQYAPDLIEPIALRATLKLFPQLRGDQSFYTMYKQELDDALKTWGRVYPHQRSAGNMTSTEILR